MKKINAKFVIVCLAAIIAFAAAAEEKKPNLIFVLTDQWRRQVLGFMNEDSVLTPNLDRFSEESAVFTHAVATVPVCAPDRAVLLTGNYPLRNGVLANDMRLDENSQSLGVVCKEAGYRTGYVSKWHIDGVRGFTPLVNVDRDSIFGISLYITIHSISPITFRIILSRAKFRAGLRRMPQIPPSIL